ncbi:hypothetical protein GCM10025866_11180 [Naasia aerilata]|uniref:Bacterial transcriptional activator domain-containing protein n=1 Tax=Naasia aerilata TaxID=1162966 RepID=A0ABN6XK28_9MICO|nr:hypothetical protein GCM10025866_11180 [Naasia aerilata]
MAPARRELTERIVAGAERLAVLRTRAGDPAAAVGGLEALVRQHPLREGLAVALARALHELGRQADALAALDALESALQSGPGIDVSAAVREVRTSIVRRAALPESGGTEVERHGVPVPLTRLVGRTEELVAIAQARSASRLVTLTGPGGVGKSRLAVETARNSGTAPQSVQWMFALADVRPGTVLETVAAVLGSPTATPAGIARRLGDRPALLLLDNAEHVLEEVRELAIALLGESPGIAILATSREPLGVPGERVVRIAPWADGALDSAVELLIDRVRDVDPARPWTAETREVARRLCERVDGLPLGIELIAAMADVYDLPELLEAIDSHQDLTAPRVAPARHASLTSVLDWSFRLLDAEEQRLLAQLSGFAGPFPLDAVEGICVGSDVRRLTEELARKSLVAVAASADGTRRYRLLESVRRFAAAELSPADREAWEARHEAWHIDLVERTWPLLRSHDAPGGHARLSASRADILAVLDRILARRDARAAVQLTGGIAWHLARRGLLLDGRRYVESALELPGPVPPIELARACAGVAYIGYGLGDREGSLRHLRHGQEAAAASGDPSWIALFEAYDHYWVSLFGDVSSLAAVADPPPLDPGIEPWVRADVLLLRGAVLTALGRHTDALARLDEARHAAAEIGHNWAEVTAIYFSSKTLLDMRRGAEAARAARAGLELTLPGRVNSVTSPLLHLYVLAAASALLERHREGAILYGAIDRHARPYGFDLMRVEGAEGQRRRDLVARGLTPAEWDEAYRQGGELDYDQMVRLALALAEPRRAVRPVLLGTA